MSPTSNSILNISISVQLCSSLNSDYRCSAEGRDSIPLGTCLLWYTRSCGLIQGSVKLVLVANKPQIKMEGSKASIKGRSTSVDAAVPDRPVLARLAEKDKQTVQDLYKQCPQLWADFSNVIEFLDLLEKDSRAYNTLYFALEKVKGATMYKTRSSITIMNISMFTVAVGFVDRCVDFSRQIMREMNKEYLTELVNITAPHAWENGCLYMVRSCFLNFSSVGMEFCIRLADTGVLQDLLEDVKHIKHLTAVELESNNVCLLSMGTLLNCCRSPILVPVLQKMNTVDHLTPFLDKGDKSLPRAMALMILAYLVERHQMDVLELNPDSLQYFLYYVEEALTHNRESNGSWAMTEVLSGLAVLAKNCFNKQLIVAGGSMKTMMAIFESPTRSEKEKEAAVKIIAELAVDRPNAQVFQRDRHLMKHMEKLRDIENQKIRENAATVLSLLHTTDPGHSPTSKLLEKLLEDRMNALTILDIGEVEYVLEQLRLVGKGNDSATADVSASDLMRVLGDMSKDEGNRREIFARDGLGLLTERMGTGSTEEKQQALGAFLVFAPHRECSMIMQYHQALKATLRELQNSEDTSISQAADNLLQTLAISSTA